ncbi:hypothetical protein SEA_WEST99_90 [Mycobacterium phage West99]|uniref:Uncharacterized protein n=1 Tax=Mycobacterium phage West99 TaxID=2652897 RepID=A0A5P8DCW2_9CAUD|nr:hypothetical protein SEA_WEST99_90 [Mycobacterium phage West99]
MATTTTTTTGWICQQPGHWTNDTGDHFASTRRVREGIIHSSEWMWRTTYDGVWLTNANTLADARAAVALASDLEACRAKVQAELDHLVETGPDVPGAAALVANLRAALNGDDATLRSHAVHL